LYSYVVPDEMMTRSFFQTLLPLLRSLNAKRTLSPGKLGVLRYLSEYGRATTSEVASAERISPQGISLAARELERLQLVVRMPDEADRRRVWIELTETGRQKLAEELSAGYGWLERAIAERLTHEERAALEAAIPILRKLGSEASGD
jgi:DNA-binding MarR family transcriptional regulator